MSMYKTLDYTDIVKNKPVQKQSRVFLPFYWTLIGLNEFVPFIVNFLDKRGSVTARIVIMRESERYCKGKKTLSFALSCGYRRMKYKATLLWKRVAGKFISNKRYAEFARDAARHIDEKGFTKYRHEGSDGVCLIGAMRMAATGSPVEFAPLGTIEGILYTNVLAEAKKDPRIPFRAEDRPGWSNIIGWNDMPGTTKDDVLSLLNDTADRFEKK